MFAQRLIGDSPLQEKRSGIDSEDGVDAALGCGVSPWWRMIRIPVRGRSGIGFRRSSDRTRSF